MENKELILKIINEAKSPLKSGEIVELTGIDKKEVAKEINKLKKEGEIYSPKRCFYSPK